MVLDRTRDAAGRALGRLSQFGSTVKGKAVDIGGAVKEQTYRRIEKKKAFYTNKPYIGPFRKEFKAGKGKKASGLVCEFCKGTGRCSTCKGTGKSQFFDEISRQYESSKEDCEFCRGSGKCQECRGSGKKGGGLGLRAGKRAWEGTKTGVKAIGKAGKWGIDKAKEVGEGEHPFGKVVMFIIAGIVGVAYFAFKHPLILVAAVICLMIAFNLTNFKAKHKITAGFITILLVLVLIGSIWFTATGQTQAAEGKRFTFIFSDLLQGGQTQLAYLSRCLNNYEECTTTLTHKGTDVKNALQSVTDAGVRLSTIPNTGGGGAMGSDTFSVGQEIGTRSLIEIVGLEGAYNIALWVNACFVSEKPSGEEDAETAGILEVLKGKLRDAPEEIQTLIRTLMKRCGYMLDCAPEDPSTLTFYTESAQVRGLQVVCTAGSSIYDKPGDHQIVVDYTYTFKTVGGRDVIVADEPLFNDLMFKDEKDPLSVLEAQNPNIKKDDFKGWSMPMQPVYLAIAEDSPLIVATDREKDKHYLSVRLYNKDPNGMIYSVDNIKLKLPLEIQVIDPTWQCAAGEREQVCTFPASNYNLYRTIVSYADADMAYYAPKKEILGGANMVDIYIEGSAEYTYRDRDTQIIKVRTVTR